MKHAAKMNTPDLSPRKTRKCARNNSLILISVLIVLVIVSQWHLASHHVNNLGSDYFAKSFASFIGQHKTYHSIAAPGIAMDGAAYITSPICGACYRGKESGKGCYDAIQNEMRSTKYNGSFVDAAKFFTRSHPDCELCDPDKCIDHYLNSSEQKATKERNVQFKFWRFDTVSPKFTNPTTLALNVIPSHLRIPPNRFDDIATFFQERYNSSLGKNTSAMDFLIEYNPGIVTLPPNIKQFLPEEATYLVSLRVTPANNCFAPHVFTNLPKDVWNAVYHTTINHLGLALLDENYQMLEGYEVVIELDTQLHLKREMKKQGDVGPTFMDYRIFLLNGEVYLHANADTTSVTKLKLRAKGFGDADAGDGTAKDPSDDEEGIPYRNFKLTNLYGGDRLEVSIEHQFNTLWSGGITGKNYALFGIHNKSHLNAEDSVYAELDITPKHRVHQVVLDEYKHISLQKVFEYLWKPGTAKSRNFKYDKVNRRSMKTTGDITESNDARLPSFFNVDSVWYPGNNAPFKESVHGGACCVEFSSDELNMRGEDGNHQDSLLVGIAHTKVPWRPWYNKATQAQKDLLPHTHYVSLFYAFDPYPPFQLRARSGLFCLGFVPETSDNTLPSSEGGRFNPHNILTRNRKLQQNNVTFDCPQMHFVSSLTQKANDEGSVVIAYGLNDCTPRLVEVTKEEIVRMLFPPLDMLFGAHSNK